LREIIGADKVEKKVFITPSCGMGALTEDEANKAMELLRKVSKKLF